MAVFNEINEFGLASILVRRLGMQVGTPTPAVAPELFPTIATEVDRPEWGFLKGERFGAKYDSVPAIAAQYGMFQLYLPSNSPNLAVVTLIKSHNANPITISRLVGIGGGLGGWAGRTTSSRDMRWNGDGTSAILERTNNAALPTRFADLSALRFDGDRYDQPIVITPGTALGIFAQTVNQAILVSLAWYERPVQPGELA